MYKWEGSGSTQCPLPPPTPQGRLHGHNTAVFPARNCDFAYSIARVVGYMVAKLGVAIWRRRGELLSTCPRSIVIGREVLWTGEHPDEFHPGVNMGS